MDQMPMWGWGLLVVSVLIGALWNWQTRRRLGAELAEQTLQLQAQSIRAANLATEAARLPDAFDRIGRAETEVSQLIQSAMDATAREAGLVVRLEEAQAQRNELQLAVREHDGQRNESQRLLDMQRQTSATSNATLNAVKEQAERLASEMDKANQELELKRSEIANLATSHAHACADRDAAVASRDQAVQFLQDAQAKLRTVFIEEASKVFDEKSRVLDQRIQASGEASKQNLEATLKPFSEQVGLFQNRIEQISTDQAKDRATLVGTIGELKSLNQNMADATGALTKALKGNAKTRGDWGELILDTVLKASGLEEGRNYSSQASTKDEDTGQRRTPDVIVNLPDGRQIVVDSKVNLIAWADANNADTPKAEQEALIRHATALRLHVRDLADKNYPKVLGPQALDMTILFVPIEGALSAALSVNSDLQTEAFSKRVVFASPNTLMAMLQVVDRLWTRDKLQKQVGIIGTEAGKLLDALTGFLEDFQNIEVKIRQSGQAFTDAKSRLSESPQSVIARAKRLVEAGAKGKRAIPEELQPVDADTSLSLALDSGTI